MEKVEEGVMVVASDVDDGTVIERVSTTCDVDGSIPEEDDGDKFDDDDDDAAMIIAKDVTYNAFIVMPIHIEFLDP